LRDDASGALLLSKLISQGCGCKVVIRETADMEKKTIIFLADGTCNDSDPNDGDDRITNVFKLYLDLEGITHSRSDRDLQLKQVIDANGCVTQTAFYIWGIGSQKNPIKIFGFNTGVDPDQLLDSAFGGGFEERLLKGYAYISSQYNPGDDIITIGFSRGAYEARALADVICHMGLIAKQEEKLADACRGVWEYYSKGMFMTNCGTLPDPSGCYYKNRVQASVKAVCVFDTVGAIGVENFQYLYAREVLSDKIQQAFHAVAIDEQRVLFAPTLWQSNPKVFQHLFPGAHADVGGGYKKGIHSISSNEPYAWMKDALKTAGIKFLQAPEQLEISKEAPFSVTHRPWCTNLYRLTGTAPRSFDAKYNCINDDSVSRRINELAYCEDSDEEEDQSKWHAPVVYRPTGVNGKGQVLAPTQTRAGRLLDNDQDPISDNFMHPYGRAVALIGGEGEGINSAPDVVAKKVNSQQVLADSVVSQNNGQYVAGPTKLPYVHVEALLAGETRTNKSVALSGAQNASACHPTLVEEGAGRSVAVAPVQRCLAVDRRNTANGSIAGDLVDVSPSQVRCTTSSAATVRALLGCACISCILMAGFSFPGQQISTQEFVVRLFAVGASVVMMLNCGEWCSIIMTPSYRRHSSDTIFNVVMSVIYVLITNELSIYSLLDYWQYSRMLFWMNMASLLAGTTVYCVRRSCHGGTDYTALVDGAATTEEMMALKANHTNVLTTYVADNALVDVPPAAKLSAYWKVLGEMLPEKAVPACCIITGISAAAFPAPLVTCTEGEQIWSRGAMAMSVITMLAFSNWYQPSIVGRTASQMIIIWFKLFVRAVINVLVATIYVTITNPVAVECYWSDVWETYQALYFQCLCGGVLVVAARIYFA
jgi:uncharacterized protein (DUF2235 family)